MRDGSQGSLTTFLKTHLRVGEAWLVIIFYTITFK